MLLENKIVLITGGAGPNGLGFATALQMASHGARVAIMDLEGAKPVEAAAHLGEEHLGVVGNVTDKAAIDSAVEQVLAKFGRIDILVNNAGIQFVSPVEDFPPERWTAIQNIILNSSFHAIREVVPGMKQRGWGRIINLASVHGLVASPFKSAYIAAKHGQIGLTKSVALELAETLITCNAICPGYVRTPLIEGQIDSQAKAHGLPRERVIREVILAAQPTKRFVEVEEVAALAVFLCSESARSITGAAIPIDGGWSAR